MVHPLTHDPCLVLRAKPTPPPMLVPLSPMLIPLLPMLISQALCLKSVIFSFDLPHENHPPRFCTFAL